MGIIVAIGIVVIAIALIGMFVTYDQGQQEIRQQEKESSDIINERIKEDLDVTVDVGGNMSFHGSGMDDSEIVGMMIVCDDGTMHTEEMQLEQGELRDVTNMTERMEGFCGEDP